MPKRKSHIIDKERSPPRHPDLSLAPSAPLSLPGTSVPTHHHPHHPPPPPLQPQPQPIPTHATVSHYPIPGDVPILPQPTYSETILQRPTIATDPSILPPQSFVAGPPSATPTSASRRQSSSSMRNASMTFENIAPTSTPTGRISKAKKGKRVHACEFPGCGKVFTRAEHRRRHELNHNPDATYNCPQPGCGKSFHRIDLLQRHQERHESDASSQAQPTSRHGNIVFSSPPSVMPSTTIASPPSESAPRTSSGGLSIGSLVHPHQNQYSTADSSLNYGLSYMQPYSSTVDPYFYGSEASHSPSPDHVGRYHRQSISSASSVAAFDPSTISPTMTTSMPGTWMPATAPPLVLPSNSYEEGPTSYIPSPAVNSIPSHRLHGMDEFELDKIQRELSTVPGLVFDSSQHGLSRYIRWDCLNHYWKYFHPSFPIVHKSTFLPSEPPPLLLTATLAIGSFYDTRPDAKLYSLALQEIATKILRQRPNITARSRIADLQTVLLLEILSKFCARHVSAQTSARFRSLFANLHLSRQWLATSPLAVFKTLKEERSADDLKRAHNFWMEHETRRRIFHACSVLDAQQVALFEQRPTIVSHNHQNLNADAKNAVNLPCSEELWEAHPISDWSEKAASSVGEAVLTARANYQKSSVDDYSFFQHQIINTDAVANQRCLEEMSSPSRSVKALSKTRFNYHAFQMASFIPVRSLLVVAGESWFLGRKVEQESDYVQAKRQLRAWLTKVSDASTNQVADAFMAHWHALKVLRMLVDMSDSHQPFRSTNMLHEDWVVYLAVLVCWAQGYGRANKAPEPMSSDATAQGISPTMSRKRKNKEAESAPRKRQATLQGSASSLASSMSMMAPSTSFHTTQMPFSTSIVVSAEPAWSVYGPSLNPYTGQWEGNQYYDNTMNSYTTPVPTMMGTSVTAAEAGMSTTASTVAGRTASNTPQSQSSRATTTAPTLTSMPTEIPDETITDLRAYLMLTDVSCTQQLASLDVSVLTRTQGVLEAVRIHKIGSKRVVGGLMNDAERVLGRLLEGRSTDMF